MVAARGVQPARLTTPPTHPPSHTPTSPHRPQGLGKTVQTIALIAHLLDNRRSAGPHIILAPKAVLPNWVAEFARWAPSLSVVLYDGTPDERRALRDGPLAAGGFHALVTHYDLALRDARVLRAVPWCLLVVDEGHRRGGKGVGVGVGGACAMEAGAWGCRRCARPPPTRPRPPPPRVQPEERGRAPGRDPAHLALRPPHPAHRHPPAKLAGRAVGPPQLCAAKGF